MRSSSALIGLFCAVLAALLHPCPAAADAPEYRVGVILPLTGESANSGKACANAITLAQEDLPAEIKPRLHLFVEDDANVARNTVSVFQQLASRRSINAVISYFSNTAKAIAPLVEGQGMTMIAIATDPEVVTGRKRSFNLWVTPEQEGRALLSELTRRGYRRIAMVSAIQSGLLAIKKAFDEQRGKEPEIVLSKEYPADTKDFRPFLSQLKTRKDIDGIFVNLMFGQIGIFAKQAREMLIEAPLFAVEVFEDPAEVAASGGALLGQWYIQADDASSGFLERYAKRFPGESTYSAGNCYDAVLLLSEALQRGTPPQDLPSFLAGLKDFKGSLGVYSATGDQRFSLPATVKIVTADGFSKLRQ